MLRPAVPHPGGEITTVSRPNQSAEPVSKRDGNTGSFQVKSNSNSASTNSVTESATTYKEKQIHVSVSDNNTENRPNAVIYLRVSSKKQADEGYSIASQDVSCNNYAQLKNFNVAKIFIDEGVSATIHLWNRPAGKAMREYIEKNKPTNSTLSQPKPTVKNEVNNNQKPVETFSGEVKQKASERTDINYADYIRNWGEF